MKKVIGCSQHHQDVGPLLRLYFEIIGELAIITFREVKYKIFVLEQAFAKNKVVAKRLFFKSAFR
jgi:hypothetical protein